MRPPIIIADGLDVSFYNSVERAALQLEGPDVLEGIYRAFDADGRQLRITTSGGHDDYNAAVRIVDSDTQGREELRALLLEYLAAVNRPMAKNSELSTLLATAVAVNGLEG